MQTTALVETPKVVEQPIAAGRSGVADIVVGIPSVPRKNNEDYLLQTLAALQLQIPAVTEKNKKVGFPPAVQETDTRAFDEDCFYDCDPFQVAHHF